MSHGWYDLPPFEFDNQKWTLARVIDLGSAKPVTVTISETKRGMLVNSSRQVGKRAAEKIVRDVRHMFRLDDDMGLFYEAVSATAGICLDRHTRRRSFAAIADCLRRPGENDLHDELFVGADGKDG